MNHRTLAAVVCVAALALVSCGGTEGDEGPVGEVGAAATGAPFDPDRPLDSEQADEVLVTIDDLDSDFIERDPQQEDNSVMSCLAVVDDFDEFGPAATTQAERSFEATYGTKGQGQFFSQVASYDSVTDAEDIFAAVRDHADSCGAVTDEQGGWKWKVKTSVEDDSAPGADEKFRFVLDGVVVGSGEKSTFVGDYQVARVGNTIIMVALINVDGPEPAPTVDKAFEASLQRLTDLRSPDA